MDYHSRDVRRELSGTDRRFQMLVVATLRAHHPQWARSRPTPELALLVEQGFARAQSYGLSTERQIMRFLHSVALVDDSLGPNSTHRGLVATLSQESTPAEQRSEAVLRKAMQIFARRAANAESRRPAGETRATSDRRAG